MMFDAPVASDAKPATIDILGLHVCPLRVEELNRRLLALIRQQHRAVVPNINVHFANLACRHPWLRDFFNHAPLNFCDGAGIMLGARLLGQHIPERITYADWLWDLAAFAERHDLSLYFLGGRPGVAEKSAAGVRRRHPKIRIVGTAHGFFDKKTGSAENRAVIANINRVRPDILIVAFGMPLQEQWLAENWLEVQAGLALTGGAVFDYISGHLRRPPAWMCRNGLEWLGRLLIEPRRLWKRYLIGNVVFLWRVLRQRFAAGR